MRKIIKPVLILLLLSLSACNLPGGMGIASLVNKDKFNSKGGPADGKCIPSSNSGGGNNTGTGSAEGDSTAEKIDKFLKENKIITTVVNKIKAEVVGDAGGYSSSRNIFDAFVQSPEYQTAVGAAFTLFVIFYGIGIISGTIQANVTDAAIRVAKIGAISAFAMNWDVFYGLIGKFFINGTDELISYFLQNFKSFYQAAGSDYGAGNPSSTPSDGIFSDLDNFIARVFSLQNFAFLAALFNAGPYAPVYGAFLVISYFMIIQSILKIVSVYVFSLFAKALLFAIAPVFLVFLLFKQTSNLFDAWLKQLVGFSLQPILVVAFVGLFAQILSPFFAEFSGYKMCWVKLDNLKNTSGWKFVDTNSPTGATQDYGMNSAPKISLQTVIMFLFFSWIFQSSIELAKAIAASITAVTSNLADAATLQNLTSAGGKDGGGITSGVPSMLKNNF